METNCLLVSLSAFHTVHLSFRLLVLMFDCFTFGLSTVFLSHCLVCPLVSLSACLTVGLSYCRLVLLSSCLSVYLCLCPLVSLSACLSARLFHCLVSLSACLTVCLSYCLPVLLSACLTVCFQNLLSAKASCLDSWITYSGFGSVLTYLF